MQQKHSFNKRKRTRFEVYYYVKKQQHSLELAFDGKTRKLLYYVVEESQVRSLFHFHFPFDVEQSKANVTRVLYVRNIHGVKGLNR